MQNLTAAQQTERHLRELYLDYVNDYLSVKKFAADHGLAYDQAIQFIHIGGHLQELHAQSIKDAAQ